jgi:type I phosphodiesterase/nucleotide pyrophosphatase
VRPDYQGACIAGVVPALLGARPADWLPAPVEGARSVVLLVLDGLGWHSLQSHCHLAPTMAGLAGGAITTVVPSTTAAALTSITTGSPPARHGMVGYRMRVGGQVLDVLRWRVPEGRPPQPEDVASGPAFLGKPVNVVTRAEFARTGFTAAHMQGARLVGWRTTATLVEHVRRLVEAGEPLVYVYYDGIDKVAHEYGLLDGFYPAEVAATDGLVGDLLEALPASTALVLTSDHGQVHYQGQVSLQPVAPMVAAYAGDGRFRYLYARPGAEAELARAAAECFDDRAWVFTREQLVDEGWLGPEPPSGPVLSRVGDVTLAAREPVAFADPTHPREAELVAGHGSLTPDEMLVPLLAGRGGK